MVCIYVWYMFGETENAFDTIKGYKEWELRPDSACSYMYNIAGNTKLKTTVKQVFSGATLHRQLETSLR